MATPLLQTKLYIPPPRPELVPRPRLIERLNAGAHLTLTLISAPAGFGKTTLLSAWTQASRFPTAWLSLGTENNDPQSFLVYVIAALQEILPDVGKTPLAMLRSTPTSSIRDALIALINELDAVSEPICLILDDYHVIDSDQVHTALGYLIDHMPRTMHIVVASRTDPPIPLSQLRARGQLLEVRQSHLRFTLEEAAAFLNQKERLNLTTQQIADLEARTEGWIASLQLAAISLREKQDASAFVQQFSGSHRFVIDYLVEEVLSHLSQELRQFLLQTAVLDRFTAALCDELTDRNNSAVVLRELEKGNLFIISLDDRREWYRYHQLFRDYLVSELDPEEKARLCKRAAAWCSAQGLYYESVTYAVASGETEQAAQTMSLAIPELFDQGYLAIIARWLDALPRDVVSRNVVLAIYQGLILCFANLFAQAGSCARDAEQLCSAETPASVQGRLFCLKAHVALYEGETEDCIHFSTRALEYLDEQDSSLRSLTYNVLGQVLELEGETVSAAEIYRQAFGSGPQDENLSGELVILTNLVFCLNELGKRQEALALCEQLATELAAHDLPLVDALCLPWSLLSYEANELALAQEQAQRALGLLCSVNFTQGILWAQYILAQVLLARHEYEALFQLARAVSSLAPQGSRESPQESWFAALEAQTHLQQGEIIQCERWAESAGFSPSDVPPYRLEYPYLTYARLLLAQGRLGDVQALLETMEACARRGQRIRKLISIALLHARLKLAQDRTDDALEWIGQALSLAAPEKYRRAFLNEGPEIARLLPQLRGLSPAFVSDVLAASGARDAPLISTSPDALTEREAQILQLVARGLSNREIAELLFITVGTVKKHNNNIFGKLQVKSRTQAVVRATELGLIR